MLRYFIKQIINTINIFPNLFINFSIRKLEKNIKTICTFENVFGFEFLSVRERLSMVVFCPELGAAAVDPGGTLAELLRPGTVGVAVVVVVVVVVVVGGGGGDDDGFDVGGGCCCCCCCCCCCGGGGGLEALNCLTQWPELIDSLLNRRDPIAKISIPTWTVGSIFDSGKFSLKMLPYSPVDKKRDFQVGMGRGESVDGKLHFISWKFTDSHLVR
uniref:Uncharacterized protein n=1 Tax=Glossina pallidipes TaxID=7398 RepID=A0A1A9ZEJ2_GLOPL